KESLELLLIARRHLSGWVHPHRGWIGEELGLRRKWALTGRPDTELVDFCITAWEKLTALVVEAHAWLGAHYTPAAQCRHGAEQFGLLLESEVFPEVGEAWGGAPSHLVTPQEDELPLLAGPWAEAERWHVVRRPDAVRAWVGGPSRWWNSEYGSLLLH